MMEKFSKVEAIAAPLPLINVDTDMIIPKQYLKTIKRTGLGKNLFDEMRYDNKGNEIEEFVLNKPIYRDAGILVSGHNFGCGSSREHAPWALLDFGIRVIIAPSFAEIFYNNCFKNGILPIILDEKHVDLLLDHVSNIQKANIAVDLDEQTITSDCGTIDFTFDVDSFRKYCLVEGLDDIGLTLQKIDKIDLFEQADKISRPWLYA